MMRKKQTLGQPSAACSEISPDFLPFAELWQNADAGTKELSLQKRIEELKREQDEILRGARDEAELIRRKAYEEGLAEGQEAGRLAGQEDYRRKIEQMEALLAAVQNEIGARNKSYEQEILLLIKAMVDRLVHHEISVNPEVIQACLRQTLQFVAENAEIRLHLHADDVKRLQEAGSKNPSLLAGKNRIQLVEDPVITAGGCLLQTDFGEVDATLENCRQKLYAAVDRIFAEIMREKDS